jgi:hypothetical protein
MRRPITGPVRPPRRRSAGPTGQFQGRDGNHGARRSRVRARSSLGRPQTGRLTHQPVASQRVEGVNFVMTLRTPDEATLDVLLLGSLVAQPFVQLVVRAHERGDPVPHRCQPLADENLLVLRWLRMTSARGSLQRRRGLNAVVLAPNEFVELVGPHSCERMQSAQYDLGPLLDGLPDESTRGHPGGHSSTSDSFLRRRSHPDLEPLRGVVHRNPSVRSSICPDKRTDKIDLACDSSTGHSTSRSPSPDRLPTAVMLET